jgi:hypothetical protein
MITLGRFIKMLNQCGIHTGANSGSYAMTDTWANLVAAHAATPFALNTRLRCSDVGVNGSDWSVNSSSALYPVSPVSYFSDVVARARAPSGTISTGSSGNITFGTAAPRAYTEGLWVYLPTIATTPAITAGWYWCVMSTTTLGTLSLTQGGAAINFTVGASYTGVTTQVNHPGFTALGAVLGTKRRLAISGIVTATANANTKTTYLSFGGQNAAANNLSQAYTPYNTTIANKNLAALQVVTSGLFSSGTTPTYLTVNTASDVAIYPYLVTGSTATDWWVVETLFAILYD